MAAYETLPWLNSSDQFLQAMIAGGNAGLQRAQLRQSSQRQQRPFGGSGMGSSGFDPLEAAKVEALKANTLAQQQDRASKEKAWLEHNRLISLGVPELEAFQQSGLGQYESASPKSTSADRTYEIGDQVVSVNPLTGDSRVLFTGQPKPVPQQRYTGPTAFDEIMGKPGSPARLTLPEWNAMGPSLPDQVRTNQPVASYIDWGRGGSGMPMPQPAKTATVRVKSRDGRTGTIPANQLEAAQKEGYTLLE